MAHCTYLLTYLITYLFTHSLHGAVFLEKLTGSQPVKKFPALYGTRKFITPFTGASHLSLSWARLIQSMPPHPLSWVRLIQSMRPHLTSWRSSLILSFHLNLGLPSGVFPSSFHTKTPYTPLLSSYVGPLGTVVKCGSGKCGYDLGFWFLFAAHQNISVNFALSTVWCSEQDTFRKLRLFLLLCDKAGNPQTINKPTV